MAARSLATRWANITLRTKITGVTVFILTLGLLVAGAGTMSFLRPQLIAQQDGALRQLATDPTTALAEGANAASLRRSDVVNAPDAYYVGVIDADGNLLYDNHQGDEDNGAPLVPIITASQAAELSQTVFVLGDSAGVTSWRSVLTPITVGESSAPSGYMLISASTATIDALMARYITIFTGFGIAVVVLGAMLTRILVTNTFEPLNDVERTASEIADGDFGRRINVAAPRTEVGKLGTSLNTMLDRIDDAISERAKTIEQMRRFIGDASHELRTPLVSVRGYAELYRMGGITEKEDIAQAMERIEKEAVRMGSLVEDLLALARLDERRELEVTEVNLLPLARDAALDAMAQSPDRTVSVVNNCEISIPALGAADAANLSATNSTGPIAIAGATLARLRALAARRPQNSAAVGSGTSSDLSGEPHEMDALATVEPLVRADENRLRQVLNNLVGNALRYTPEGSPIEIAVTPRPYKQTVRIEVIDHGEGIPESVRNKIFERFWRADTSRNRETGGSGLGLAIVASIVAAHDGTVSVHETPGGGATFRVELPLVEHPLPLNA